MNKRQIYFIIFFVFIFSSLAHAEIKEDFERKNIQLFLNDGIVQYNNGEYSAAIRSFCRVLMLDPRLSEPFDYLNKILAKNVLLPKDKINLILLSHLLSEMNNLSEKITYYETKTLEIKDDLKNKKVNEKDISGLLSSVNNKFYSERSLPSEINKTLSTESNDPLYSVNDLMNLELLKLKDRLYVSEKQYEKLVLLNRQNVCSTEPPVLVKNENFKITTPVLSQEEAEKHEQLVIEPKQPSLAEIKKLSNDEVVKVVKDLDNRFALGQKIIQEKQTTIDELQGELTNLRQTYTKTKDALSDALQTRELELVEAVGILEIYKDKFHIAKNDFESQKTDLIKTKTLLEFKNELNEKILKEVALKESDLKEADNILNIYKDKLKDAQQAVKEKKADISTIEEQLDLAQKRLFEREKMIKSAQTDFELVTKKLNNLETQINDLKKSSSSLDQIHQDQIKAIQIELKDLKELVKNKIRFLSLSDGSFAYNNRDRPYFSYR